MTTPLRRFSIPALILLALCSLALAPAALAAQATQAQQAAPKTPAQLKAEELSKLLAEVEALEEYGEGLSSYYKKAYLFHAAEGKVVMAEAYIGYSADGQGKTMEWSGRYVYELDPLQVHLEKPDMNNLFFRVRCQGHAKCIEYRSLDAVTIYRNQPAGKPQTTSGIMNNIKVNAGTDPARLKKAHALLGELLGMMKKEAVK